jgi:hypothetical protein
MIRSMALCFTLARLLTASAATAQSLTPDTTGLREAATRAQSALKTLPSLWGMSGGDVRWIFTDGRAHVATEGIGTGVRLVPVTLPAGAVIANHAVDWNGRRFAMVILPLPADSLNRTALLVHEAMHTFQPEHLPRAANTEAGDGGALMDSDSARTWLFLELRALASAMTSTGSAQRRAAHDALVFRARRDALALPRERERLDGLDLSEGLPEYTGMRLAGISTDALAAKMRGAPSSKVSWVRATGYWTGPAYGYVLDQLAKEQWRSGARAGRSFSTLLTDAVGPATMGESDASRWSRYAGDSLWRVEQARAVAHKQRVDSLRALFVTGPVLRLVPGNMRVSFDPNGQFSLGGEGTVMRGFRWAGTDSSELVAPEGALVGPQWDWVQVPLGKVSLPEGSITRSQILEGQGWRLSLPIGWRVTRTEGRTEARPPR